MLQNQNYMYEQELLLKKLIYQSNNRGCKETDVILGNFSKNALGKMSEPELNDYQYFLSQLDADIWNWVNDISQAPDHVLQKIVNMIKGSL